MMTLNRRMTNIGVLLGMMALTVALLGACTSDDDSDGDPGISAQETSVSVTLKEWSVDVDTATVSEGEVTFDAQNVGTIPHELVVIRSDQAPDSLPVEGGAVPEDQVDVIGEVEEFPAGESASGTFSLEAGRYILICNIPAHYEQGMYIGFSVE